MTCEKEIEELIEEFERTNPSMPQAFRRLALVFAKHLDRIERKMTQ